MTAESGLRRPRPLTVAVTGPTGDIGRSLLRVLERSPRVGRVVAMARRPFDPAAEGLTKTEYRQADVLDPGAVDEVVAGADVVVHLAFMIMGSARGDHQINLTGSRNVFDAAVAAAASRLVYASSVAAYGFAPTTPRSLTEDLEPRGTARHYYSAQKAELEARLRDLLDRLGHRCLRLSPVHRRRARRPDAGGDDPLRPAVREDALGASCARSTLVPALKPVLPDPGVPFQLVHHDDVATALEAACSGAASPGSTTSPATGR